MNLTIIQSFIFFGIISITTMFIRALPFALFPENRKPPKYIVYLGQVLPYTIIGMLVVYCLKDVTFLTAPYGIAELISIMAIVALHLWKKNTLLSIGGGTIIYMLLIQII
jgi:branched-subunit amino acid transport protein AzlD